MERKKKDEKKVTNVMVLLVQKEERKKSHVTSLSLACGYLAIRLLRVSAIPICSRVSLPNFISCYAKGV